MSKVIAVAKLGKNVLTETDPNSFVFHSQYNTFKIITQETKNITLAASTNNQSFTEAHGLEFIPLVTAFAKRSGVNQVFLPNGIDVELWGAKVGITGDVKFNYITTDQTNITFNFDNAKATTVDIAIRYFVLESL